MASRLAFAKPLPASESSRSSGLGLVVAVEMAAWSILVPALKRVLPLRRLVKLMSTTSRANRSREQERRIIALSARFTRLRPRLRSNCLERSLLAYRFLARAGADPRLVLGVSTLESAVIGHAWVTLDGEPIHEPRGALENFAPLLEFGYGGEATKMPNTGRETGLPRVWR